MKHLFDVDLAKAYGIHCAILLENLAYWIKQNEANKVNFFDGTYWTYNSRRAYKELFPYMSERQIDTAFRKLIESGLVITGNFSENKCDRTLWYALTSQAFSILHFDGMHSVILQNAEYSNKNLNIDITNINNNYIINVEFEELWKLYPNKQGKIDARKSYVLARQKGVSCDDVKQGILRYCEYIKATKMFKKYIKHGSTWFGGECWNDEYTVDDATDTPPETKKGSFDTSEFFQRALKKSYEGEQK